MKAISVILFKLDTFNQKAIKLFSSFCMTQISFFQRSTVRELAIFGSRNVVQSLHQTDKIIVQWQQEYKICAIGKNFSLYCVIITDNEYPIHVTLSMCQQFLQMFESKYPNWKQHSTDQSLAHQEMDDLLIKMQTPTDVDKISQIQQQLNETQQIIINSIEDLQKRGTDLKDIAQKAEDLSKRTKIFVIESEKLNSCCCIL